MTRAVAARIEPTTVLRRALTASVAYNLVGGVAILSPASVGRLLAFPSPAPRLYTSGLAMVVLLYAGVYAWLARAHEIDRPLVAVAAMGKIGFFVVFLASWAAGEVPGRAVVAASGDLWFALVFGWWLWVTRAATPPTPA